MTFKEFYLFYLGEHSNRTCRKLHFWGLNLALVIILAALVTQNWWLMVWAPVAGYGFAFLGHTFQGNRPASLRRPFLRSIALSFASDWKMWWQIWTGQIKI